MIHPLTPLGSVSQPRLPRGTLGLRSLQEALHGDVSQPMPRPVAQFWLQMLVLGGAFWVGLTRHTCPTLLYVGGCQNIVTVSQKSYKHIIIQ